MNRKQNILITLILLLAFGLRWRLLFSDIDYDEAYTYLQYGSQSLITAIGRYNVPNNHFLNSFAVWLMDHLWSGRPEIIRIPHLLSCLATLFIFWRTLILKRPQSLAVNVLCVLAVALSYPYLEYSVMIRGYMPQAFFVALYWYGVELHLHSPRGGRWWFLLAAPLALWCTPTGVFPVAGLSLYWLWQSPRDRRMEILKAGTVMIGLSVLLYLAPLFYFLLFGTKVDTGERRLEGLADVFRYFEEIVAYFWGSNRNVTLLVAILYFLFPFLAYRQHRSEFKLWICLTFAPILIISLNQVVPPFHRIWIWFGLFLVVFAAGSLIHLLGRWKKFLPAGAFALLCFPLFADSWHQRTRDIANLGKETEQLSRLLAAEARPGDYIVFPGITTTRFEYWSAINQFHSTGSSTESSTESLPYMNLKGSFEILPGWDFSIFRLDGPDSVLREPIQPQMKSRFWLQASQIDTLKSYLKENYGIENTQVDSLPGKSKELSLVSVTVR